MSADEYVPSEDEVRRVYSLAPVNLAACEQNPTPDYAGAQFDRFLARVRRDAWQAGHATGFEDTLLACEIAIGTKPGPPPGPTPNPHKETP